MILPSLWIITQLRGNRAVSKTLAGIEPLVTDTLGSVRTLLLGMDWDSPIRDLDGESSSFGSILEEVARIRGNERIWDPITPALAKSLERTCGAGTCIMHASHSTRFLITDFTHVQFCRLTQTAYALPSRTLASDPLIHNDTSNGSWTM